LPRKAGKNSWDWQQVTYAKTVDIYEERWSLLKALIATWPAVLEYLEKLIIPFKDLFVVAWACQHPHLQNFNTSQVESGHAYLKTFVTNSTGDLLSVFKSLAQAVDAQISQVHESVGKDTMKTLVNVPKLFLPILEEKSSFAIKQALQPFDHLKKLNTSVPCSQTLTKGVGIPCAHEIAKILESGMLSP
jgi:hypothetical protein